MYKVYCDKWLLHNSSMDELKIIAPKLDLEVNKTGSFTFTIYPSHPYYGMLKKLKSIITVYQNDEIIFRGRILNDEKGFKNEKQVTCEGELAFLLDSTQRPYDFQGDIPELFQKFIDNHNAQVEEEKRFKVGQVTVKDPNGYINRSDTQYLSTYDSIFKKLIDTHDGYLNVRHEADANYIDYLEDFTKINSQDIELCKNLLDLKCITKGEDIATVIIPLGAKVEEKKPEEPEEGQPEESANEVTATTEGRRLTIESVNDGKDYVYDEEAVNRFGWIAKVITWDDVTLPENLLRKANEELANAFLYAKSLEVTAVDLSGTNKKISSYRVGTYNNVKSPAHDIEEQLLVTKLSLNLTNPKSDKLTLGKTFKSFTDQDKDNSDIIGDIIDRVDKVEGDYDINKPLIEEILNKLTLDLSRNHSMLQSHNPTHNIFIPDYTKEPLVITPTAKYRGKEVVCSYVWKRMVDGVESTLEGWEGVGADGNLTIRQNMADRSAIYKCYATYKKGATTLVASEMIDFNRVDDGEAGQPGEPGKDAAIQSPTPPEDKTQLWLDTSLTPPLLKQWNGEEWIVVNDMQEQIESLRQEMVSSIEQASTSIKMEVSENYYQKGETDTLIASISTTFEQLKDEFIFKFDKFNQDLEDLENGTNAEFQKISEYIRFKDGNIEMGAVGNEFKQVLTRTKNAFSENGVEIAYFGNRKMHVTDGEFEKSMQVGNFAFIPRENGNLSFMKVR